MAQEVHRYGDTEIPLSHELINPLTSWMRATILDAQGLHIDEIPSPMCAEDHVRVRLAAAALNHRDQYIREGKYSKIVLPAVLGSDGMGVVTEAPSQPDLVGTRVVIYPELSAGNIIGMPTQGTLAQEIVVPAANVFEAPEHLSDEQAAALPLAGLTAFRALMRQGALQATDTVLITGIGGGVATMVLLFAVAAGARVCVSGTSDEKLNRAVALGASYGINIRESDWAKRLKEQGSIDLVIDSIGGDTFNDLTDVLVPGGRVVIYGAARGAAPMMNLHRVFWKQLHILGSTMGSAQEFADMLQLVRHHSIVPVVDRVYAMSDAVDAFDRLHAAQQFGKIVVSCS